MKRIALILSLFVCVYGNAQVWFDLGLKGGGGAGFLLNKTISNDVRLDINPSLNNFYGGKIGVNFGAEGMAAFNVECTYSNSKLSFIQSGIQGDMDTESYKYTIGFSALNILPTFRFTKDASYIEIGSEIGFVKNPSITDAYNGSSNISPSEAINSKMNNLVFGFGGHFIGNEIISLMMGLRFKYQVTNLTGYTYEGTNFPFNNYNDITTSNKTNAFSAQIVAELNYSLGYFVRASCGRRTAFLTF